LVFLLPLIGFVAMLRIIPPPDAGDVEARSERSPMTGRERLEMLRRHGFALLAVLLGYLLLTVLRSVRADFAPEIWQSLGFGSRPGIFTRSEFWVGLAVIAINGAVFLVRDNRRAFFISLWICAGGLLLALGSIAAWHSGALGPFHLMVLLGVGMYLPYVAVHTTVFERLIALTREKGNIGFLMYLADATGYLGYCGVMLARSTFRPEKDFLPFFLNLSTGLLLASVLFLVASMWLFTRRFPPLPKPPPQAPDPQS
jgi:hypothetical protein